MTNAVGGQYVMWRHGDRRAVTVVEDNVRRGPRVGEMGNGLEPVGTGIFAGQHRDHAGHSARRRRIDAADYGMRMGCPQHRGISLSGKIEIVTITAAARDEAQILLATYRVSDACLHRSMFKE